MIETIIMYIFYVLLACLGLIIAVPILFLIAICLFCIWTLLIIIIVTPFDLIQNIFKKRK